jgi:hypothetical protein
MTIPPAISPDGAYWWDGAAWQPVPREEPEVYDEEQPPGPPEEAEGIPEAQTIPSGVPMQQTMRLQPAWAVQAPHTEPAVESYLPQAPAVPAIAASEQSVPWAIAHEGKQARPADVTWLPEDVHPPAASLAEPSHEILQTTPPASTLPPLAWKTPTTSRPWRRAVLITLLAILAIGAAGEGWLALRPHGVPQVAVAASPSPQSTPTPLISPSPSPLAGPLTAQISSTACPVAHVGDPACLKVTLTNTGPPISVLAMIFDTDKPYTDWFQHHTGASLAKTDPAAGCNFDLVKLEVVCGPVPAGSHLTIVLTGFVASLGTYQYAVHFGDLHAGYLSDVNLNADGTQFRVFWTEGAK